MHGYVNSMRSVEQRRQYNLKARWGLTPIEFNLKLAEQNFQCAICSNPLTEETACIDHDHKTKRVRELLCNLCNRGLGHFKDDATRLSRAADYLDNHSSLTSAPTP